nr:TIGR00730 family Rossman fold protein [uncultured Flavobacterium sp.]
MKNITVFCASSFGNDPEFEIVAYNLGKLLAENSLGLVYGGAQVGLMGAVANGALQAGGTAVGVLPVFLETKEIAHPGLTEFIVVDTMHERKTIMSDRCDGVIALPGGFGTMEELFEVLTWAQLGLHKKPIGLLNVAGFYDALIAFIDQMVSNGLLKQINRDMLLVADNAEVLLQMMNEYVAPDVPKWLNKETT